MCKDYPEHHPDCLREINAAFERGRKKGRKETIKTFQALLDIVCDEPEVDEPPPTLEEIRQFRKERDMIERMKRRG